MPKKLIEPEEVFSDKEIKEIKKWISRYENPFLSLFRESAEQAFHNFDLEFFKRTGLTEEEYLNSLLNEVRLLASRKFIDMPNGSNDTMFNYPEDQRQQAYKNFEAKFVAQCIEEENRLRFKAYVARRFGFSVPFK